MLILSRYGKEAIRIGDDIRILVIEVKENYVRLGFEAPKDVQIFREEIYFKRKKAAESQDVTNTEASPSCESSST